MQDETTTYTCCLCSLTSEDAELFILGFYITPMCKRCHNDGATYGWD
jgi:hypothetical protein